MGYTDPCSVPPVLQAACWAPVDAISGHCQLMSQSEANRELRGLAWTTGVENPSDYLLFFYDSLVGAGAAMDREKPLPT